jgi:uncharacterized membrane protein YfhO
MKRKDITYLIILILTGLMIILVTVGPNNIYGSETDWLSQHWALPEYFRTLFYKTGNLFPNFAPNLGAGQNIYNFSYYGLLNPIILIAYLLPFVKMIDYIIISSIIIVLLSAVLFYKWLKNNRYSSQIAFISAFVFMLANPIIFHSHRHIMFINYIPFIILGLMGIDKYFNSNKKWLLILSVFLLIMTSYFYSVGGLITIGLYGIYKMFADSIDVKSFVFRLLKMIGVMLVGVLMAGILLMPTIGIIVNGRGQAINNINVASLFLPKINDDSLLYTPYSLGLTAISVVGLIHGYFSKSKKTILLSLMLSIIFFVPLFVYLLNGMLYVRYKVLIPFAPLIGLLIAKFLKRVFEENVSLVPLVFGSLIVGMINFKVNQETLVYFLDILILFISLFSYYRFKKETLIIIPIIVVALINSFSANVNESFVTRERYKNEFNNSKQELINKTIESDFNYYRFNNLDATLSTSNKIYHPNYFQTSLYSSTYNNDYNEFYYEVFKNAIPYRNRVITAQSSNILFQTLMGVKYLGTSSTEPIGYELINGNSEFKIYKNESVFPLAYATNKIMNIDDYNKLEYPYNLEPLLTGVVANDDTNYTFYSKIKKIELDYFSKIGNNIEIEKNDGNYYITASKKDYIDLDVTNLKKDQILIIKFDLLNNPRCSSGDIVININGVRNVLTCREWIYHNRNYSFEYVISSNDIIDNLKIEFAKGIYEISKVETYILDYNEIKGINNEIDQMEIDMNKTQGDYLYGNIKVSNNGYFVTTIPYDEGFTITLNGKEVIPEVVNKVFLGFPVEKGNYKVVIKYESPLFKEGVFISGIGIISYIGIIIFDNRKKSCK